MVLLLIDAHGREWDPTQPWIYQHLGFRGSARELIEYAVRNLGFASVAGDHRRIVIRVRPDYFSETTLETVVKQIGKIEPARIGVAYDIDATAVVLIDPSDAVAHLGGLRRSAAGSLQTSFYADDLSVERLKVDPWSMLGSAFARWRAARGRMSSKMLKLLFDDPLRAPWMIGSLDRTDGLVTRTVPEYVTFWGSAGRAGLIGKPMVNHPDKEFGRAAERSYLAVHRDQQPKLEVVTTVVRPAHDQLHWGRYHRLILPWRTTDGTCLLSSISSVRVARDVPSAAAA